MPNQSALPGLRDAMKKKVTRREQFLAEMDAVVPWGRVLALIAPHYPKSGLRIPRKMGIDSTRSWALVPRHLGQPFHAKVGS